MNFKTLCLSGILAMASTAPLATQAQDLVPWGEAGPWDILVDRTLGDGCLIQADFVDGSTVRIGLDPQEGTGYVMVFNNAWGDIEQDVIYPITFALDGAMYDGEARGLYLDGVPGADIVFTNPDFLWDLAKKYTMTIFHDGEEVLAVDLAGSYAGLDGVLACQEEMG